MFRRWHTGHSLGAGLVGGIILSQHGMLLAAGGFLAGLVIGRGWWWLVHTAELLYRRARVGRAPW